MLLVAASYSLCGVRLHVTSCVLEILTIESWANKKVYEKILFAELESGFFKQSKIMYGW